MCGICGYVHLDKSGRPSEEILRKMMDALVHRGPDDAGMRVKDNTALGHRRLSIIDLETGRQPMSNEDGSITIVYNGEIYNFPELREGLERKGHKFRTHSDTEVIIHAYEEHGEKCLDYFNGMFAFALWDSKQDTLFLARDRFGKKPLYYCLFDNQFIFASELKSLVNHPAVRKQIDLGAISRYLAYEYIPSPYSIFKNVNKLEAGSRLILKGSSYRAERYWNPGFDRSSEFDLEDAKRLLYDYFKESVRKRLISDVPLGVFLSGGIDSSSVVAAMAELVEPKEIKTFSVGFEEKSHDESDDARAVARHFGTDHREETVNADRMVDLLPSIIEMLDEPFADSSIIPTYAVSRFTRRYVKAALGGDGGDELFMGYPSFLAHQADAISAFLPDWARRVPMEIAVRLAPEPHSFDSLNMKLRRYLKGLYFPREIRHQIWIGGMPPSEQRMIFAAGSAAVPEGDIVYDMTKRYYTEAIAAQPLDRALYIYVKTYLADDILSKVDRASMANSLEVRAPFLDKDFAQLAMNIPFSAKLKGLTTKWIWKEVMKEKLPPATLSKRKHGFAVPVGKWLKSDLRYMMLEAFGKKKIEREGIFDYTYVSNIVEEFLGGRVSREREIWSLFMFEKWLERWE